MGKMSELFIEEMNKVKEFEAKHVDDEYWNELWREEHEVKIFGLSQDDGLLVFIKGISEDDIYNKGRLNNIPPHKITIHKVDKCII